MRQYNTKSDIVQDPFSRQGCDYTNKLKRCTTSEAENCIPPFPPKSSIYAITTIRNDK